MAEKKFISVKNNISFFKYIKSIWDYRFFTFSLAQGEIKNKYARNVTGSFLSVIQTLIGLAIYWLIFGITLKINTGNIPYPVFVLPGIIVWQYFSYIIGTSSGALINSEHLISKLYFPRIVLPISKAIPGFVDFLSGLVLFIILFIFSGQQFNILWLSIPVFILLLIILALAFALWSSILSLYVQDLSQIIIQVTNFLIFITPVFYPGSIVPEKFRFILYLNPVAGLIEFFRAFLFNLPFPDNGYLIGFAITIILFIISIFIYKKLEKKISDML